MFPPSTWWGENTSASLRRITDSWFSILKNFSSISLCLGRPQWSRPLSLEQVEVFRVICSPWEGPTSSSRLILPSLAPVGDRPPHHPARTTQALRLTSGADRHCGKWNRQERGVQGCAGLTLPPRAGLTCWTIHEDTTSWGDKQIIHGPII